MDLTDWVLLPGIFGGVSKLRKSAASSKSSQSSTLPIIWVLEEINLWYLVWMILIRQLTRKCSFRTTYCMWSASWVRSTWESQWILICWGNEYRRFLLFQTWLHKTYSVLSSVVSPLELPMLCCSKSRRSLHPLRFLVKGFPLLK